MLNCVRVCWIDEVGIEFANVSEVKLQQHGPDEVDPEGLLV